MFECPVTLNLGFLKNFLQFQYSDSSDYICKLSTMLLPKSPDAPCDREIL